MITGSKELVMKNKIAFDGLKGGIKHDISFAFKNKENFAIEVSVNEN